VDVAVNALSVSVLSWTAITAKRNNMRDNAEEFYLMVAASSFGLILLVSLVFLAR
jgi:hypothetical protein